MGIVSVVVDSRAPLGVDGGGTPVSVVDGQALVGVVDDGLLLVAAVVFVGVGLVAAAK